MNKTEDLKKTNEYLKKENTLLSATHESCKFQLQRKDFLLELLENPDIKIHVLTGNQTRAPRMKPKIYINDKTLVAFVDLQQLPAPPDGKAYQLWSLVMEPFESTNITILNEKNRIIDGIHKIEGLSSFKVLAITLEPDTGSTEPTLSEIYAMDMSD